MYLDAYHNALSLGFSEREAERIADDAWEEDCLIRAKDNRVNEELPVCDICGEFKSVCVANGFYVCSEECFNSAMSRDSYVAGYTHNGF